MFQHLSSVSKNFPLTIRFIIFVLIPIIAGSWYVYAKHHDGLPSDRTMLFNGEQIPMNLSDGVAGKQVTLLWMQGCAN